ncbi:MAG: substrate-binding domain-containing protein [Gammaproteobacteria bacterium]|nr:substrate-binding domain-containing protein [Gammaproteobacteria bacterium]MDE0411893.1 substrate-binding domain-containing protein [Gammaproteobacteria bacterium]
MGLVYGLFASPGIPGTPTIGLIVKTDTNPFFVKMKEAAHQKAAEFGIELRTFAGRYDGDTKTQIKAIRHLVAAGAQGILLTPSDPAVLAHAVLDARKAGVLVIALDTPFDPPDTTDATFATDNFRAGELIGRWAKARMGAAADSARVVTLDGSGAQATVDVLRNQGFLRGFGIDLADPGKMYDENDVRIIGHGTTHGTEAGGRSAMEALLRQKTGVNVVYTINEPAASGVHAALRARGMEKDVLLVSIDGGCRGVSRVATGALGATAMQYPLRMASLGVKAVVEFVRTGKKPETTPGLDFYDTGVTLVTDEPVAGIPSISSAQGLEACWG